LRGSIGIVVNGLEMFIETSSAWLPSAAQPISEADAFPETFIHHELFRIRCAPHLGEDIVQKLMVDCHKTGNGQHIIKCSGWLINQLQFFSRMHTILVVTDSGCEEACALEIARYTKKKTAQHRNIVSLEGTLEDACTLGYHLQTARRVLIQVLEPLQDISLLENQKIPASIFQELFPEDLSFKAEAEVLAMHTDGSRTHLITAQELTEEVGAWVYHQGRKVNLKSPDIVVFAAQTSESTYIGIDVIGRSLSKREWRIILSRRSLKATVAASVVVYAGCKDHEIILDPLSDDGTLAIEAALMLSSTSPLFYAKSFAFQKFPALQKTDWKSWKEEQDKRKEISKISAYGANLQEMKAIRTNAKLAGIEKDIHATKVTLEWVETKFEENSVDRMIAAPMPSGKSVSLQQAKKHVDELFYQAEYVLKKNKTITCITEKPEELLEPAKKYGFTVEKERYVLMGMRRMAIVTFKNGKRKT
jgi:23S rRNA G2445 N2-methylase RlmL